MSAGGNQRSPTHRASVPSVHVKPSSCFLCRFNAVRPHVFMLCSGRWRGGFLVARGSCSPSRSVAEIMEWHVFQCATPHLAERRLIEEAQQRREGPPARAPVRADGGRACQGTGGARSKAREVA